MLKHYTLYVTKPLKGTSGWTNRELTIKAASTEHARCMFERFCKRDGETLMSVFPNKY